MKDYQLYIFDWDGTLMDSVDRIVSSIQKCAELANLPIPDEDSSKAIIGLSLPVAFRELFPSATKQQEVNLTHLYKQQYVELNSTPTPMFDGVEPLLKLLKKSNKLLAVATGKGRQGLERVWQESNTDSYFDASRCSDEAESKPSPDMVEQLLAELKVAPEHAVVIGDSRFDMAMAQAAGVDRVAVTYGADSAEQLASYQPKYIVNSIAELTTLIR